ncbi:MAG: T9SS type A sorting domain-containing protein [candidate division WOR-3 bacterium]|nr:T9SS type A sorting domain-containing protein [candidate division WOR-3 bacterium]
MKQTTNTVLLSGPYSLDGYTQVYQGVFPDYPNSGWLNVQVPQPFYYDNTGNLSILILKTYQQWHAGVSYWRYTPTTRYLARYAPSDTSQPIYLNQTNGRCNLRLVITQVGIKEANLNKTSMLTTFYPLKPNLLINGTALISFSLAEPTKVTLKIYDAEGRQVKTLLDASMSAGIKDIIWNRQDDNNKRVSEGVYFVILETTNQKFTQKVTFLR